MSQPIQNNPNQVIRQRTPFERQCQLVIDARVSENASRPRSRKLTVKPKAIRRMVRAAMRAASLAYERSQRGAA